MSHRSTSHKQLKNVRQRNKQIEKNKKQLRKIRNNGIIVAIALVAIFGVILIIRFSATPSDISASGTKMGSVQSVGLIAPNGTLTTTSGQLVSVKSFRGKPTLLWFVTTWCSSCQASTQTIAQNMPQLESDGVRVVEVELYQDLGQTGPSISTFGEQLAGNQYGNSDWIFANSSSKLTKTYDPSSYLDIYYLLNKQGRIEYVNSSPSSTMSNILAEASRLT